jgi:hypothetical protein
MPSKSQVPFANFVDLLKNMPPAQLHKIIDNHKNFHRLQTWCSAKGMIQILPNMTGIKVLQHTPEVAELKNVIDELKPGGFKWLDENDESPIKK